MNKGWQFHPATEKLICHSERMSGKAIREISRKLSIEADEVRPFIHAERSTPYERNVFSLAETLRGEANRHQYFYTIQ